MIFSTNEKYLSCSIEDSSVMHATACLPYHASRGRPLFAVSGNAVMLAS